MVGREIASHLTGCRRVVDPGSRRVVDPPYGVGFWRRRNSRPVFTRGSPLYSTMSAVA